ncbi:MAG TPA: hypothetical protein VFQ41_14040 [Candidatus Angelobacter sp.]|nr:hypothetical protein [Candidatus Angelobacter sp.]
MPNITSDPGAKKETVYSGPSPQPRQSSGPSSAASSSGSTVYGGPAPKTAGGTVYNGLGEGGTVYGNQPAAGTVYSPAQSAVARPAQAGANAAPSKAGSVFFVIAGFSALNAILTLASAPFVMAIGLAVTRIRAEGQMGAMLAVNAVAIGIFVALGFFASRGSKAALLIGLLLYAGDTALLLLSENPALHVVSIIVHGIFLFSIFKGFRQLS